MSFDLILPHSLLILPIFFVWNRFDASACFPPLIQYIRDHGEHTALFPIQLRQGLH